MFDPNQISELERQFKPKPIVVSILPSPKSVRDHTEARVKNKDGSYDTYEMISGNWQKTGNGIVTITKILGGGSGGSGTAGVTSFNGRAGVVNPAANDYTWAQIDKSISDIADITTKSHTDLDDIGTNTHAQIDTHIANTSNPHSVTKSQVGLGNVTDDAQLKIASNLSDVNNQQTALDNLANVSAATNEHVLTKDTTTGNAIFKALPGGASGSFTTVDGKTVTVVNGLITSIV